MVVYRENVGLLALTKAGSRRVIQISSIFMILFSIFGALPFLCFFLAKDWTSIYMILVFVFINWLWIRKIWCHFCIDTYTGHGSVLLYILRLCVYVSLHYFIKMWQIPCFLILKKLEFLVWCSICRLRISPILQPQQFQNKTHTRIFLLHGTLSTTVLQRALSDLNNWPCPHACTMGTRCTTLDLNFYSSWK